MWVILGVIFAELRRDFGKRIHGLFKPDVKLCV